MWRALACFLTAIAWLFAAPAHAEYIGEYDVGDTISLHCVVNDNGTAADSVSGDTIKAIIMYEGTKIDTIGLDPVGTTLPLCAAFQGKIVADTTVGGYGTWWATLWAVNVGAGTRDPVGVVSWTLYPRIASASGIVPRVSLTDSGTSVARVLNAYLTGNDKLEIARRASDSVWVGTRTTQVNGRRAYAALVADSVNAATLLTLPASAWYIGQYEQGESLTIGARLTGIDSAYATIYWRTEAIDTVELSSTAQGYYLRTMADTTGGGWGDWRAVIRGYDSPSDKYVVNTWSLWDRHLYAQEVAESADVYIHDPDDSTLALVIRDSLNAWADSFKADTVVASGIDTVNLSAATIGTIAAAGADSTWSYPTRSLPITEYQELADTVSAHVSALDTIAYVANVGAVAVTDSARAVGTVTRSILTDSAVAAARVREVTLPVDSVVGVARVKRTAIADSFVAGNRVQSVESVSLTDSSRALGRADSCVGVGRVRLVDRSTLNDSTTAAGRLRTVGTVTGNVNGNLLGYVARLLEMVDSLQAEIADESADSANARLTIPTIQQIATANRDTMIAHRDTFAVSDLDSIGRVGKVWECDSTRVARTTIHNLLTDSTAKAAVCDSTGLAHVTHRADSLVRGYRVDTLVAGGRVGTVATVTGLSAALLGEIADTVMTYPIPLESETLTTASALARADTVVRDSVRAVGTVYELIHGDSIDAFARGANVSQVAVTAVAESLVHGASVDYVDTTRVSARTREIDEISYVDSVGAVRWAWNVSEAAVVAYCDSNRSTAVTHRADSLVGGGRIQTVLEVTHADSVTAFDHGRLVTLTSRADSTTGVARVKNLTNATIAAEVEAIKAGGSPWPTVLAGVEDDAQQAVDSLTSTEISTLAHVGDEMTLTGAEKAEIRDSTWYTPLSAGGFPFPMAGNILWNIQEDSLALPQTIAGMGADSTRAILAASALQDSIDAALVRMGKAGGDTTLVSLLRYIKSHLNAVTFTGASAQLVADSLLGRAVTDASGDPLYDSSTVGGALYEAGPDRLYRSLHVRVDSSLVDTSGTVIGAFKTVGGTVPAGTCIYAYTLSDSSWSQAIGKDCDLGTNGEFYFGVFYQPPDTTYYRIRMTAPGYTDVERIVRFPQP
jgi:hypothetical protein